MSQLIITQIHHLIFQTYHHRCKMKKFYTPDSMPWFHTDLPSGKRGIHCIQSFINLETIEDGDGCFSVLVYSLKHHQEFFEHFNESSKGRDWFMLRKSEHLDWYLGEKSCVCFITAPKGFMVFWD